MRSLADNKKTVRKLTKALMWWFETEMIIYLRQKDLKDKKISGSITFNEKLIKDLTECSNKILRDLRRMDHLFENN